MAELNPQAEMVPVAIQRRITSTLFASQSLFSAAQIASFTLLPVIAVMLSGNAAAAGVPATIALLGRAVAAYPFGWLMDRIGRRNGLALGYLIAALGSLMSAVAVAFGSFIGFSLGAGLSGMGRGTSDQARFAAAEVQPMERRAKAIGLIVFASTIGAVGGPLLVEPARRWAASFGLNIDTGPYLVAALLTYVAMMLCFIFLRPDPMTIGRAIQAEHDERTNTKAAPGRPLKQIFQQAPVRMAVLSMVIGQLVMTMIMVITSVHMFNLEHTAQDISWVIMAHTLGMFGLASVTGWLIDRLGRAVMIAAGALLLVAAAVLAPVAQSVALMAVALFILGLGWNFTFIAGSSMLSDALTSLERGRVQGANETMVALASGVGSLSVGVIYASRGMAAIGLLGMSFALILLAATFVFSRTQSSPLLAEGSHD